MLADKGDWVLGIGYLVYGMGRIIVLLVHQSIPMPDADWDSDDTGS